ncbi:hypothetical protein DL765_000738 [Monosporascus sp. GIB2]|nr:hypothetical protein DL765_000738 [Monosporascus sp. GIB2]
MSDNGAGRDAPARVRPPLLPPAGGEVTEEDVSWMRPDHEQYDRYLRLCVERAAPGHRCSRPQRSEVIDAAAADGDGVVVCRRCGVSTCARCRRGQHRGIGYDQAPGDGLNGLMRRERLAQVRAVRLHYRPCYCGHEFCYICGEAWQACRCPIISPGVPLPAADNGQEANNNVPVVFPEGHGAFQHFPAPQAPYPRRPAAGGPPRAGPFMIPFMNFRLPLRPLPADQFYIHLHPWSPRALRHPFYRGGYLGGGNGYAVGPIHDQLSGTGFGFVPPPGYQPAHRVHRTTPARKDHGHQIPLILHPYGVSQMNGARQPHHHPFT